MDDPHQEDVMGTDQLEDLLREGFAPSGDAGGTDVGGLRDAILRGAEQRRRRSLTGAVAGGAAAVALAVTGVAMLSPWGGAVPDLDVATGGPSVSMPTSKAPTRDWSSAVHAKGLFAYSVPDLRPDSAPAGTSARKVESQDVEALDSVGLEGAVGSCWMSPTPTGRIPVAGTSWWYDVRDGSGGAAAIGVAGFATGTGAAAERDYLGGKLDCDRVWSGAAKSWSSPVGEGWIRTAATPKLSKPSVIIHEAIAILRRGDLLVTGSATAGSAETAQRVAGDLATSAVRKLDAAQFPPALGRPLGRSEVAGSATTSVPTGEKPAASTAGSATIPDVLPTAEELPTGLTYGTGTRLVDPMLAPAASAHVCDTGRNESGPRAEAGLSDVASSGAGGPQDPTLTVTVTRWARGTGASRFADVVANRLGSCRWLAPQDRVAWTGHTQARSWLSSSTVGGTTRFLAVQVSEDYLVAVEVWGIGDARDQAARVSDLVVGRVRDAGVAG